MPKETKKKNPLLDEDTSKEDGVKETDTEKVGKTKVDAGENTSPAPTKVGEKKVDIASAAKSDIQRTKAILDAEPKVRFLVPLAEGEKAGATHDCFINGYKYTVKKGVMMDIPSSIAELLANHYKIISEAGQEYRIDGDQKKEDALL